MTTAHDVVLTNLEPSSPEGASRIPGWLRAHQAPRTALRSLQATKPNKCSKELQ